MLQATQIACKTDTGRARRDNEDSAYAGAPLFVVADGMGGAQAGEVASQIAIETFEEAPRDGLSTEQRLAELVRQANRRIHERAHSDREHAGMGTTLTAAYMDGGSLVIAHVGDSRAYLLREGTLKRLTRDHSLVGELVERGKLTEEQAAEHPQRSIITRALGPEADVAVDTWTYPVRAGDVLLLCSDGLTSMVSEDAVAEVMRGAADLDQAADELIAAANAAGGRDNITVVLFGLEDAGGEPPNGGETTIPRAAPSTADVGHMSTSAPAAPSGATATATRARATPPARPLTPVSGAPAQAPAGEGDAGRHRVRRRYVKPAAALATIVALVCILSAAGYLATRQLYFIGTDSQGVVTIYRGLPYGLPLGLHLYETVYVSGVPASLIPADRRASLLDNHLRSQSNAVAVVRALELGEISQ